jgi:hypothetical protein
MDTTKMNKDLSVTERKKKKKKANDLFEKPSANKSINSSSTRTITYKQKVNKRFKQPLNKSNNLNDLSKLSKIPLKILREVYNKGSGAYESSLGSVRLKKDFSKNPDLRKGKSMRLSKSQWSYARVYAFIEKTYNKKEPQNQDPQLMKEARKFI